MFRNTEKTVAMCYGSQQYIQHCTPNILLEDDLINEVESTKFIDLVHRHQSKMEPSY